MFGGNAFAWPRFADWFVTPPPTPVIPKREQGGSGLYARRHGLPLRLVTGGHDAKRRIGRLADQLFDHVVRRLG